jgi:hypothetical protein
MATDANGKVIPDEEVEEEVPEGKTFSQEDVNRLIGREKAKTKLYKEQLEQLQTGKDETLTKYENTILKLATDMSKDVPDPIKKLLAKLSPLEQLEYLNDTANNVVFEHKQFPLLKKKAGDTSEFKPFEHKKKLF